MVDEQAGGNSPSLREIVYSRYRSRYVGYEELSGGTIEWKKRVFLPLLSGLPESSRIVELGCGAGELLEVIRSAGYTDVLGVDVSAEQTELARSRGVQVELADAFDYLRLLTTGVECIIAVDFFEHFTHDELALLLPLIHHNLVPGGRLIVQTVNIAGINGPRVGYGDITHMTVFTESSIEQLLRTFDFDDIQILETGPRLIGVKGCIRVALWRIFRAYPSLVSYIETGRHQRIWTENLLCCAVRKHPGSISNCNPESP